jgi:hypothetical protein
MHARRYVHVILSNALTIPFLGWFRGEIDNYFFLQRKKQSHIHIFTYSHTFIHTRPYLLNDRF